jgi:hypothetical protein
MHISMKRNFIISPSNIKTILDEKKVVGFGHQFINFFGHTIEN